MPAVPPLPLHPAIIHFPIAGAFFAAGALLLSVFRPSARDTSLVAALLLLGATLAGGVAALVTGYFWADQLAYLAGGWGPIPGPKAVEGLARQHALLAFSFLLVATIGLALSLLAWRKRTSPVPALLASLVACALAAATGHIGGTMVHAPPPPKDDDALARPLAPTGSASRSAGTPGREACSPAPDRWARPRAASSARPRPGGLPAGRARRSRTPRSARHGARPPT